MCAYGHKCAGWGGSAGRQAFFSDVNLTSQRLLDPLPVPALGYEPAAPVGDTGPAPAGPLSCPPLWCGGAKPMWEKLGRNVPGLFSY